MKGVDVVTRVFRGFAAPMTVLLVLSVLSCSPKERVYIDLETYSHNAGLYDDKEVVLKTSVDELAADPAAYEGRRIQLEAPVLAFSGPQSRYRWTWNILVGSEETVVKCHGDYRFFGAMHLVRKAHVEEASVLIEGGFSYKRDNSFPLWVRISSLSYGDLSISADVAPNPSYGFDVVPQYSVPSLSVPGGQ
jgi:hypothetical protein